MTNETIETAEKMESTLVVRGLNAMDVLTLAKLIARIGKDAKDAISEVNNQYGAARHEANKVLLEAQMQDYDSDEEKEKAIEAAENEKLARLEAIQAESGQDIAITVLTLALEKAEDYLVEFLADLVNTDNEGFKKLSFSAPVEIIYELAQRPDFTDFFVKAQKLAKIFMK